jgi:type I restriction enzyme, R subunit
MPPRSNGNKTTSDAALPADKADGVRPAHADQVVQASLSEKQRVFVEFVLGHYVKQGVDELDIDKLAPLLRLKYGSIEDATATLGDPGDIRRVFIEFQRYLYEKARAA